MSLSLPAVTDREVLKTLVSIGFVRVSTKGSHAKVVHPDGRTAVVPMHGGRDIPRGTPGSVLRQAGLTVAEFRELLRDRELGDLRFEPPATRLATSASPVPLGGTIFL